MRTEKLRIERSVEVERTVTLRIDGESLGNSGTCPLCGGHLDMNREVNPDLGSGRDESERRES